ncbi:MAG: phytoene desaturase family protein [Myxococcota bacterium]|jgi:diapolycopene oxygenase|nr:phytoene desaturase family protein [Myxococcota bacterium]
MSEEQRRKVVVIGGGLGGLSAAVGLSVAGFEVLLLEKNQHLGGKLNLSEQDGFRFDLGPSIIILPQLFKRVFERAGRRFEDYVRFRELQPQWRSFFESGVRIDLHSDMRLMEAELAKLGADAKGYWRFIEYSRRLYQFAEEAYLERGADTATQILAGHSPAELLEGMDPTRSMHAGVARFIQEPHLQHMLDFFIKYVGSSPYDAPALMNLLPYSQLGFGLWYVEGGMYALAQGYRKLLDELGVSIELGTEVTAIRKQDKHVMGVSTLDGRDIDADVVVSNMEVIPAYRKLMGESGVMMRRYEWMFEPAASGLVLHLGIDRDYPQLQHHNFFFSGDPKHFLHTIHREKRLPEDPTIYLVCPTRTDPQLAPAGHHILKILPHLPYVQEPPFSEREYEDLEQRVLDKLERMGLHELRKHVVTRLCLRPEDIEKMYYSYRGAIYGTVAHRWKNLSLKAPKRSERYENLYFVGGSVNPGGGTPMVTLCGQLVAAAVARDWSS